jgi:predicted nicotinamide N-methyase
MPEPQDSQARILGWTELTSPPLVPELELHLITSRCALWRAREADLRTLGLPDPYWAFCWGGGQALARYILDRPALVRGRRVLDFGAGCGVVALAAARCGAARVCAADVDPWATAAVALNAARNGLEGRVEITTADLLGRPAGPWDVVLAGDMTYDPALSARVVRWLAGHAARGALALLGDLGRGFVDGAALEVVATLAAPTDVATAAGHRRPATIYRVGAPATACSSRSRATSANASPGTRAL